MSDADPIVRLKMAELALEEARAEAKLWEATWRDLDEIVSHVAQRNKIMRDALKRIGKHAPAGSVTQGIVLATFDALAELEDEA